MPKPSKHVASLLSPNEAPEDDSFEFEAEDGGVAIAEPEEAPEPAPKPKKRAKAAVEEPAVETATETPPAQEETDLDRIRRENTELRAEQARRQERIALLRDIQAQNQQQRQLAQQEEQARVEQERRAAERPDPLIDPVGAQLWDQNQTIQALQGQLQQFANQQQHTAVVSREQQVWDYTNNDFRFARTRYTDFDKATEFLRNGEIRQLQAAGLLPAQLQTPEDLERANAFIQQKLFFFASAAAQNGRSIADLLYNEAKAQGYREIQQQQAVKTPAQGQNRLAALQKGQKLQGLGGKQAAAAVDSEGFDFADFLDNASDAEVVEFLANPQNAAYAEQALAIIERGTVH